MSRPCTSYPNQASAEGFPRLRERTPSVGLALVNNVGNAAITRKSTMRVAENQNIGLRRRSSQALYSRPRGFSLRPTAGRPASGGEVMPGAVGCSARGVVTIEVVVGSLIANPRVQEGVHQVH